MNEVKKHPSLAWEKSRKQAEKADKVIALEEKRTEREEARQEEIRTEISIESEDKTPVKVIYITSGFGKIASEGAASTPICQAA
ncbi:hypothetical protein LCY76_08265 [Fictibacillus sp. KIGAM418]|uniref:Uncharacterized protein n=1 Tax=Fictibacillus marinisediminis TaxID=2878389 RepID=A0A9X2BCK5_9BACL|nr:hypothetical protein [Fictibacillus marinisediminis]MCK6256586.1 hypothetical protein [Fictibacillus marinisediminis]